LPPPLAPLQAAFDEVEAERTRRFEHWRQALEDLERLIKGGLLSPDALAIVRERLPS